MKDWPRFKMELPPLKELGPFLAVYWKRVLLMGLGACTLILLANRGIASLIPDQPLVQIALSFPLGWVIASYFLPGVLFPSLLAAFRGLAANHVRREVYNDHIIQMLISMLRANNIEHPIIDHLDDEKGGKSVH